MRHSYTVKPGGKIEISTFIYDEVLGEGHHTYDIFPCSEYGRLLPFAVDVEDGVTLADIFKLVRANNTLIDVMRGHFIEDYLEAFKRLESQGLDKASIVTDKPNSIVCLHISHQPSTFDRREGERTVGDSYWNVCGGTRVLEEDFNEGEYLLGKAGERITYSLSFTPLRDIINLPLMISDECLVYERSDDDSGADKYRYTGGITFFELLDCIFNEIGFHGGEDDKQEAREECEEACRDVDLGFLLKKQEEDNFYRHVMLKSGDVLFDYYLKDEDASGKARLKQALREEYKSYPERFLNGYEVMKAKNWLLEDLKRANNLGYLYDIRIDLSDSPSNSGGRIFYPEWQLRCENTEVVRQLNLVCTDLADEQLHSFWVSKGCVEGMLPYEFALSLNGRVLSEAEQRKAIQLLRDSFKIVFELNDEYERKKPAK